MKFLCYPETIPDSTTIWLVQGSLKETGKIDAIWQELQRQLDETNLKVKKGLFKMRDPSPLIRDMLKVMYHEVMRPRHDGAEMELG